MDYVLTKGKGIRFVCFFRIKDLVIFRLKIAWFISLRKYNIDKLRSLNLSNRRLLNGSIFICTDIFANIYTIFIVSRENVLSDKIPYTKSRTVRFAKHTFYYF